MPKIDLAAIPQTNATGYPPPFDEPVQGRWYRRIAPATGLTDFTASHVVLKPGAWSSQRHWHAGEDEMLIMIAGEAVLVEDDGRHIMRPGDIAVWPKGVENGHHLINETDSDCVFVALGGGKARDTGGSYSDIDMKFTPDGYFHKDGTPYPTKRIP
ncbi:cupin domain-containing protein [Sphingopyxis sp. MWB1]|uniref:cupin domain-containing protein n=1 Tax=Sphingopyxis sp. MWB1 TaxID=1537715 RepID=UPI000AB3241E|nr:cupin domain-containing protein [Sphingopyxis sp. MWB1]